MDKRKLINYDYSNRGKLLEFLINDESGKILDVFDDEGIEILSKSENYKTTISYILSNSSYSSELLHNEKFVKLLFKDVDYYYACLSNYTYDVYDFILEIAIANNVDITTIAKLFSYFNINYQMDYIANKRINSEDLLYSIFKEVHPSVMATIIDNYDIDLLNHDINLKFFFSLAKESVQKSRQSKYIYGKEDKCLNISSKLLTKEMADKLWNEYNIFEIRNTLDDAQYCTDISYLNKMIKNKEDNFINNEIFLLQEKGNLLCDAFEKYKLAEKEDDYEAEYEYRNEYRKLLGLFDDQTLSIKINDAYKSNGIESVKKCIDDYVNYTASNYIIDACFEVNYYDLMIDMRELLSYHFDGNISLDEERVYLYDKISNIDYLPLEEKIEFYNQLKQYDIQGMFYDDMSFAREMVGKAIKDYSLSSETLQEFKDEILSKEYGVPVYKVDGKPFFGIVKTINGPGSPSDLDALPTGHSFSLIGDKSFAVFGDSFDDSTTFLYNSESFNPKQLVHAFPYDSFTMYRPFEYSENATNRVNMLLTPSQLVETSNSYNELVILEKGKKEFDFDDDIPRLKQIALYCLDEIKNQDVAKAKHAGVGILLIDSSKYKRQDSECYNLTEHKRFESNYEYYRGMSSFEAEKHR